MHSGLIRAGAGESGKSTILKRIRLLYTDGFSMVERQAYRSIVFSNLVLSIKTVLDVMEHTKVPFEYPENVVRAMTWNEWV
jgi:guanine nucleotide-binding protein subunit alpha